jgi:cellulose synthase/poly-beta-1,6-N-acetylglucosamine synthase-like glycosyltransferase
MKVLFWISTGMIIYSYAIYPLILVLAASLRQVWEDLSFAVGRRDRRQRLQTNAMPYVSIVFSAYNEEAVIAEKVRNCAELDYPSDRLEILVGCDGCSDDTGKIARAGNLPNARILEFSERGGKPAMLNRLAQVEARGEILVLTDANTMLARDAVRMLLRHFSDPRIGCVSGELRLKTLDGSPVVEGLYWRYETFLKFLESRLNLLLGANGAIYAVRRKLFEKIPPNGVVDDFLVAMKVRQMGYRLLYDPEAIGYEGVAPSYGQEFARHVRIGAGNYHAIRYTLPLLMPTAGWVALSFWSHKIFRWLVPFALVIALFSALGLGIQDPLYAAIAAGGGVLIGLALIGYRLELHNIRRAVFSLPYYFMSMNLALLLGFVHFVTGKQGLTWQRTARDERLR